MARKGLLHFDTGWSHESWVEPVSLKQRSQVLSVQPALDPTRSSGDTCFVVAYMSLLCMLPLCLAAAKSLQSCPTLCDPIDSSPPGSPVPGILQARTLEWVAISFSTYV